MSLPSFTAEASLYKTSERYQQETIDGGSVEGSTTAVYPSAVFRGCYWNYYDCDVTGFYGVMNGY